MTELPIIDFSEFDPLNAHSEQSKSVLDALEAACRDIGFVLIRGHGIDENLIQAMRSATQSFFERPLSEKNNYRISQDNYRGFIPLGFFSANEGGYAPDRYEGYKLHWQVDADHPICQECDLYGPNKWPNSVPDLEQTALHYWQACDTLSEKLLQAFALILGLPQSYFEACMQQPLTNMTLLHYPAQDNAEDYGIHPHKDTDVLTILAHDPVGGLRLRPRGQTDWVSADAPEDCVVVNIGDLLELWSGGYFVSTPHKVLNPVGGPRYSFPYFVVPRHDTVVSAIDEISAGFSPRRVHVGDISKEVWRTNWPGTVPQNSCDELGTLSD